MTTFYNFSGGMESAAMLVVDRERIDATGAIVSFADTQAMKVIEHYPALAAEWMAAEERKGHSFLPIPLRLLPAEQQRKEDERFPLFACSCFGGTDEFFDDADAT